MNKTKLLSIIIAKYGSLKNFSGALGECYETTRKKLNGKQNITLNEVQRWVDLLEIKQKDILDLFFYGKTCINARA